MMEENNNNKTEREVDRFGAMGMAQPASFFMDFYETRTLVTIYKMPESMPRLMRAALIPTRLTWNASL